MSKKLEDIFKERFEHFEAEADLGLFQQIVNRRKRRALLIWWQRGRWIAAGVLLLFLLKFAWTELSTEDGIIERTSIEHQQPSDEGMVEESTDNDPIVQDEVNSESNVEWANESNSFNDGDYTPTVVRNLAENPSVNEEEAEVALPLDEVITDQPIMQDPVDLPPVMEEPLAEEPLVDDSTPEPLVQNIDGDFNYTDPADSKDNGDPKGAKFYPSVWSLEFTAGPGYAFRSLSGNQQLIDWRNQTESPALSYQANVAVVRELSRNWSFRTGIMLTQRQENFSFEQINRVNTYNSFAVPLEMDNRFYRKQNFAMSARLGLMFRLHEFKDGLIRVGENDIEPISDMNVERSGYIAMNFGLGLSYRISPRIEVLAQPQWSHSSSSTFNDRNDLTHRDYGFFTRFGLRVNL